MTSSGLLATASVVAILSGVALAAVLSAPILAPLTRFGRRAAAFAVCLVVIWALAALLITLIRRTIRGWSWSGEQTSENFS
jgi:hypothetical protein